VKASPVSASAAEAPAPLSLDDLPALPAEAPAAATPGLAKAAPQASLADEVAQLQKAKLALKGGNAGQALSELTTYAQRFPRPMLGTEAAVLRIEALHQSGDATRAKTLAEGFLAKNPNSPYAARLRSLTGAQ
jgi:outer membrane protein assembly factor BamD (BamD/ComL family)